MIINEHFLIYKEKIGNYFKINRRTIPYDKRNQFILDWDIKREPVCCVYFLIKNNVVVYIGLTNHIFARINQHRGKDFDFFRFIETTFNKGNYYEYRWIKKFKPKYNKNGVPRGA